MLGMTVRYNVYECNIDMSSSLESQRKKSTTSHTIGECESY